MNATTQTRHGNQLAAKVAAVNRANAEAMRLFPLFQAAVAPFVGQKITTAPGPLMAKVQKALPAEQNTPGVQVWRDSSDYSLRWCVKTCEPYGDHFATYAEASFTVGELASGVLTKLCEAPILRTDYSAEAVIAARQAVQRAKEALREAQAALFPFGEYDN